MLFEHHKADLKRSGLSDEMIAAMGCESFDSQSIQRRISGASNGAASDGYSIPYPGSNAVRYRLSTGAQSGSDKAIRYLSPIADAWDVYVPAGFDKLSTDTLLITEGEKKAAKAVQEGIPAIAIPGVWMWRDPAIERDGKMSAGTPIIPRIAELAKGRKVVILADSDAKANQQVKAALTLLAKAIAHQVECEASVFAVCPAPAADKVGLDDWLLSDGTSPVHSMLVAAEGFENPGFRLSIPYAEKTDGSYLHYLIPFDVKSKPILPPVLKEYEEDGETMYKATGAPYLYLRRNLLVLNRNSDGEYRTNDSDAPAEVLSEVEGVTDDRRAILARLKATDLSEKEGILKYGLSGSPAEFSKISRAQRNARMCPTVRVAGERGWLKVDGRLHYLYSDCAVTPEGEAPVLPNLTNDREGVRTAGASGDFDRWADIVAQLVATHPVQAAVMGFAASSAGLFFVPDAEPGVLHIYGDSSKGKTTTLQIAASLIGRATNPRDPSSWIKGWRTTDNGLERPLADTNHAPLMLDEIHAAPARTDWQATAYMIANGRGKERMKHTTEARKTPTWELQLLSSGEVSMGEKIRKSAKGAVPGGLAFRVIDLYAGNLDLVDLGIHADAWEEVLGYPVKSDAELAEALETEFSNNYGHFWPQLIGYLRDSGGFSYAEIYERFRRRAIAYLPEDASTIAQRRTKHVASAMAGLYTMCELIGMAPDREDKDVIDSAEEWCYKNMLLAGIEDLSGTEAESMIEVITAEILANAQRFYRPGVDTKGGSQLGWIDEDGSVFLPVKTGWSQLCQECGIDSERARDALMKQGWKKGRYRHPASGSGSNPTTTLKAFGLMKSLVSKDENESDDLQPL